MRLFLDTCSLNRPWDDQTQVRIHLEAESVLHVIDQARQGTVKLVSSDYLLEEIAANPDPIRHEAVLHLLTHARFHVVQKTALEERAEKLAAWSLHDYDALHIAAAEAATCDFLLTTDDKFIRRAARAGDAIRVKVLNPFDYPPSSPTA
jgi:predicted nucleic acid-binding protein